MAGLREKADVRLGMPKQGLDGWGDIWTFTGSFMDGVIAGMMDAGLAETSDVGQLVYNEMETVGRSR